MCQHKSPDFDNGLISRFSDWLQVLRLLRLQADVLQVVLDVLQELVTGRRIHHREDLQLQLLRKHKKMPAKQLTPTIKCKISQKHSNYGHQICSEILSDFIQMTFFSDFIRKVKFEEDFKSWRLLIILQRTLIENRIAYVKIRIKVRIIQFFSIDV